ncbi:NAD-dependent epimerase/dehydratase family protein [Streptomyces clavifer]|uniref:NAD-dependent epimerase/dehydratase family protein n=1 Tax=Streptomyces clavifer TaxID=68188 RepID=UPI0036CF1E59
MSNGPADMSSWPRTLITGGFGFLATYTAAGLLAAGHRVVLIDNRDVESSSLAMSGLLDDPRVSTGKADITVDGALDRFGEVDYIIHAAALLGVASVRRLPAETLRVNIDGTVATLRYASRNPNLRRFALLSTSEVYGAVANCVSEDQWLSVRTDDARWSYAVSKATSEALAAAWSVEQGIPMTVVRPFNVYGPLRTGTYAVGALGAQAVAGRPITVHGDGSQWRSWCHAEDFANGLVRSMYAEEAVGQTFNIGDDRYGLSIAALAARIRKSSGSDSPIEYVEHTAPDVHYRVPDLAKARNLIGHDPVRDFDEGLAETMEWIRAGSGSWPLRLRRDDWPVWNSAPLPAVS